MMSFLSVKVSCMYWTCVVLPSCLKLHGSADYNGQLTISDAAARSYKGFFVGLLSTADAQSSTEETRQTTTCVFAIDG
jgi:hypothetical protein